MSKSHGLIYMYMGKFGANSLGVEVETGSYMCVLVYEMGTHELCIQGWYLVVGLGRGSSTGATITYPTALSATIPESPL